jgi:pimeloyl-ACP methyl ester carboxylesterase
MWRPGSTTGRSLLVTAHLLACAAVLIAATAKASPGSPRAPQESARVREHFKNTEVIYDWVANKRGEKLRTFITHPKNAAGKVPAIFIVGWLSCDSMEYSKGETDGFGALMLRLIDQSGYATVRMDKPGVGESTGNCAHADFKSELEGWQAAFNSLAKYDFIDLDRVFVLGLSNGGGFSPLSEGSTRCADIFPPAVGGARGTSTCWSTNAGDSRRRQVPPRK